ncbi:MAG: hypothetical protein GX605_12090 [Chloroflexi bacterium]|nr:hypothetical protein [Chloroflexota bacterium]
MAESRFEAMIQEFAEVLEWVIQEMDEFGATCDFEAESGAVHALYITLSEDEDTVEFDIPSAAAFEGAGEIPCDASIALLKRNALLPVGAWVLEQVEEQWGFSLMWNLGLEDLERMDPESVSANVATLVEECDRFNRFWAGEAVDDDEFEDDDLGEDEEEE